MYAGTLSYFAQLQAQYELSALASKIKTLQLANQQGQQIYKIDNTNIDSVLPKLNLSDSIKNDIQNSINQGKYVITHTDNVSVPEWSGAGYAVIDPLTGSDAYMISGGENGGFFDLFGGVQGFQLMIMSIATDLGTVISNGWSYLPDTFMSGLMTLFNQIFSAIGYTILIMDVAEACGNQPFLMLYYMTLLTAITLAVTLLLATLGIVFAILMNMLSSALSAAIISGAQDTCSRRV